MSTTPNIDTLLAMSRRLTALLEDPHPGLASWVAVYAKVMGEIDAFWNGPRPEGDDARASSVRRAEGAR